MAMAICPCPKQYHYTSGFTNYSLTLYRTKPCLKANTHLHCHYSSSNHSCSIVQEDEVSSVFTGIGLLLHAGGSATSSVRELMENSFLDNIKREENELEKREERWNEVMVRRKRRRKRRSVSEERGDQKHAFVIDKMEVGRQSRFMTPKEEARYSWYLKERARIEGVRMKLVQELGKCSHELGSSEWAKAAGISPRNLDRILCNGRESEERITNCYRSLIVSVASSYQGRGLSLKDLTQEGSIGLLRGAIKFNPDKGYKLSTYAYWWIRQAITRAIANKSKIIKLPGSIIELVPKICEANNALARKLRRFPTYEEIAEAIDSNVSVVRLALERNRPPISLDQAFTSIGYISLQDIIPGPDEMIPEMMMKKDMLKLEIQELLRPLCEREACILRLHYGLNGETPLSFEEIGKYCKLSRERVRQINYNALFKLQQISGVDGLKYFI